MTDIPENNNPYNKSQRSGHPHTIKWCAWEILLTEGIATEERIAEIIVERGLRDEIKATSIAKELGGDKTRFASSPEGWSIIPPIDDDPIGPSRRSLPTATAPNQAPKSPVKRKEPPDTTSEEPTGGRRRTKSASEWWKVNNNQEQHGGVGVGAAFVDDEDDEIDIMTGALSPAKSRDMLLLDNTTKTEQIIDKKEEDDDGINAPAAEGEVRREEEPLSKEEEEIPPAPPVAVSESLDVENNTSKPTGPAAAASTSPQAEKTLESEKVESAAPAATIEEDKSSKDFTIKKEGAAPLESTQPSASIPVLPVPPPPPPAQKGFVIPKRRSSAGPSSATATAAAGGGGKDGIAHRNNRTSGAGGGGGASLRRPPSMSNIAATDAPAGTAGRPPLPHKKQQPWEYMLQEMKGAFASAWKRLEWPSTATSLPHPTDPESATEEQKAAWEQARINFGAPPPPEASTTAAAAAAAADGTGTVQDEMVLQHPRQEPYPPLPPEFTYLRIMQCTNSREQQCLDRNVFVSNHRRDTEGIEPGRSLIVLYNFDKNIVYGCYRAVEVGMNLDNTFQREWCYHVRVEPILPLFSPLPGHLLEAFLPRKLDKNGEPMKFFEKGTPAAKEVWHLMQLYSGKGFPY